MWATAAMRAGVGSGEVLLQLASLAVGLNTLHNGAQPEAYLQPDFWSEPSAAPDAVAALGILKSKAAIQGLTDGFFTDL